MVFFLKQFHDGHLYILFGLRCELQAARISYAHTSIYTFIKYTIYISIHVSYVICTRNRVLCVNCVKMLIWVDVVAVQHGYINGHPFQFMTVVNPNGFLNIYAIFAVDRPIMIDERLETLSNVIFKQSENKEEEFRMFVDLIH